MMVVERVIEWNAEIKAVLNTVSEVWESSFRSLDDRIGTRIG